MPNEKYFSEQEVTRIIKRAVEVQQSELASQKEFTPGVSLEELERIAAEIGVSPEALARAIDEKGSPPTKRTIIRFKESFQRVLPGELDPNDFDIVTRACKINAAGGNQAPRQVGRTLEAQAWTGAGTAMVSVSSRKGRTKVEVTSSPLIAIMAIMYPGTFAAIFGGIGVGVVNPLAGVGTAIGLLGLSAWGSLKNLSANNRKSEELADRIASTVAEHLSEETPDERVSRISAEIVDEDQKESQTISPRAE